MRTLAKPPGVALSPRIVALAALVLSVAACDGSPPPPAPPEEGLLATADPVEDCLVLVWQQQAQRDEPFDREKFMRSDQIACRKRPIDGARIERLVSGIQRQLETSGENEVQAQQIGAMVMEALKGFDNVAYIRFASVYRDFTEAKDFEEFASTITEAARPIK